MLLLWLFLFCACALWRYRQWRLLRMTSHVPTLPGMLPIIGHAHHLMGDNEHFWDYLQTIQATAIGQGGITKLWIGPHICFVVTNPQLAQGLLLTFEDKAYIYDFATSWIGQGLATADVSTWRRHRKLLNPTFNQHILNEYLEVFNENSRQLVKNLEMEVDKDEFNILPYIEHSSLLNVLQTALGLSSKKTKEICNKEYADALNRVLQILVLRLQTVWMHLPFLYRWTNTKKEEEKLVATLKNISSHAIHLKKAEMKNGFNKENKQSDLQMKGFLDHLLELQAEGLLTDKEISEEVDTMIMGGSDTTATGLLFILVLLASHPDVQDRVYDEIQKVLADSGDVNKTHLSQLVYMEAVIKEVLRIYPMGPVIARNVNRNFKQGDIFLPSGSTIVVLISGIHRSDCWGKDADVFRPERWLDGSVPKDPAAFAAFSLGRRNCVGQQFGMMNMKTTLVHLIRRYRVSRQETKLGVRWSILLKPVAGHHVSLTQRKQTS